MCAYNNLTYSIPVLNLSASCCTLLKWKSSFIANFGLFQPFVSVWINMVENPFQKYYCFNDCLFVTLSVRCNTNQIDHISRYFDLKKIFFSLLALCSLMLHEYMSNWSSPKVQTFKHVIVLLWTIYTRWQVWNRCVKLMLEGKNVA